MSSRPSVLIVTTVATTLEAFLLPLAQRLRSRGWRMDAAACGATESVSCIEAFDSVFDVPFSRQPLRWTNIAAGRILRAVVQEGQYDIVHVHTPVASFVTRVVLRSMRSSGGLGVIYTAHGFHFYSGQRPVPHAAYRQLEKMAARWTDRLIVINREDELSALRLGTIEPTHVIKMPGIGVDCARYSPDILTPKQREELRSSLGVKPEQTLLLCIAEFIPRKRHHYLLDALARTRSGRVVTLLVGEGPLEAPIRDTILRLGLCDCVRLLGFRSDVPELLAAADGSILLSEHEGLPRAVLESMASARPVIGTDIRGIRDILDSQVGWLVPQDNAGVVAAAIDALAEDVTSSRRKGVAGRKRVCDGFSEDIVLAMHQDLYESVLSARRRH